MENKNNLSILVLSCDNYSDLWTPFFECFFRYWPNCEYSIYLGANKKTFNNKKIKTLLTGTDKDWSSSLRKIVHQIDSDYIFIFLEDIFLVKEVDDRKFKKHLDTLISLDFNHCHINNSVKPDFLLDDNIGIYEKGAPYRLNVLGLWKKEYLLKMLIDGETPWNFEVMGSYRSAYNDGIYCLLDEVFKTVNTVEKGCWFPDKLKIAKKMGLKIDLTARKILSGHRLFKSALQIMIVKAITSIHWKKRLKLMNLLRRIFFSY